MGKDFVAYYRARGKEELKSILLTLWSGFLVALGSLMLPILVEITYGDWVKLSEVLTITTLIGTIVRSLTGAILFAAFPDQFRFRVTGKKS